MTVPNMIPSKVKDLLEYEPESGLIFWKVSRRGIRKDMLAGCPSTGGYKQVMVDGITYATNRIAFYLMTGRNPTNEIDHKNGDTGDDSWDNLREATTSQNQRNAKLRSNNTSGVTGVYLDGGKWKAHIFFMGKVMHLGSFDKKEEAVAVRHAAEKKHYGEFTPRRGIN